jgi:hypothetical protein
MNKNMETQAFRVDPRMVPPVVLGLICAGGLLFLEGLNARGILLIVLLAPFGYLAAEILARTIIIDPDGIIVQKFLRTVRLTWNDVTSLDAVKTGNKVFLILQGTTGRPVIISNTITKFSELAANVLQRTPLSSVAPGARELLTAVPSKIGPVVQAWLIGLVLAGIIAGKLLGAG